MGCDKLQGFLVSRPLADDRLENWLLARAGVQVQWRDNQSGCKGVCDGLPNDVVDDQNAAVAAVKAAAPQLAAAVDAALPRIRAEGLSVVIVEQDIDTAVRSAQHVYCLMHGRVSLHGRSDAVSKQQISAAYFGLEEAEEVSA